MNAIQSNANHVPVSSPNLTATSSNNVTMQNLLRANPNTKHLNEMAHRHSFNESIYSEPYGGRYLAGNSNRSELSNRTNPLCESASASNIYTGNTSTINRTHPQFYFPQTHLSHRDVYATTSSVAINGQSTDVSSTRSSVYSDKTILNESTPPSTPRLSHCANEQTIKVANNPNKSTASNASGSQSNTQSKPIYTTTVVLTQQSSSNNLEKSTTTISTENNFNEQSKIMLKVQIN